MNCYDEIFNTIKELIENKEISSYQINKDTGISYGNINAMRRRRRISEYAVILLNQSRYLEDLILKVVKTDYVYIITFYYRWLFLY